MSPQREHLLFAFEIEVAGSCGLDFYAFSRLRFSQRQLIAAAGKSVRKERWDEPERERKLDLAGIQGLVFLLLLEIRELVFAVELGHMYGVDQNGHHVAFAFGYYRLLVVVFNTPFVAAENLAVPVENLIGGCFGLEVLNVGRTVVALVHRAADEDLFACEIRQVVEFDLVIQIDRG